MKRFDNKVVIITGGSTGIGWATSSMFAEEGATVYMCSRHKPSKTLENVFWFQADVSNPDSCESFFNYVKERETHIDVLVACAGITKDSLTKNMDTEQFNDVISVNLGGVFSVGKLVGEYMENQGWGSIVAVGSVVGKYGNVGQANYSASKAGIVGLCKSWAKEFARKGAQVRVNVVAPGFIKTDMLATIPNELLQSFEQKTMLQRLGNANEVAKTILFLASDDASYITGTVLAVDGGMRL